MQVDAGQTRRYPFAFCDTEGCYSRLGFTEADVDQMRRGSSATLTVVPAMAPDQEVVLEMSLSGFTAGMAAIAAE
jgi:invasion protein IalB